MKERTDWAMRHLINVFENWLRVKLIQKIEKSLMKTPSV